MASTTSGTTTFNLDVDEIIEAAKDDLGGQFVSGIDAAKARRALNLVLIELQNKNIPLNKISNQTLTLVAGTQAYTLPISVVDVLTCNIAANSVEIPIERYSESDFHRIPEKNTQQRPTVFMTERLANNVNIKFWPIPDDGATYTATLLVSTRIEDVTASYQKLDISYRYLPLIIAWLRYRLAAGVTGFPVDRLMAYKQDYTDLQPDTFDEDRERADWRVELGGISGW